MRILKVLITLCLFSISISYSAYSKKEELFNAARNQLSQIYSENDIRNSVEHGFWNESKSAAVIIFHSRKKTAIFMFIADKEKTFKAVDISPVEYGNLGKIGIGGRKPYSRIESVPVEWIQRNNESFRIKIRTRAWKDGQRYTVYESLTVTAEGKALFR